MRSALNPARVLVTIAVALAASLVVAVTPGLARDGKDDRPEVRVAGTCSGGAKAKLRLRADNGEIELEFEIEHARAGVLWRVALVHERRVAWKGSARTRRPSGSFAVERALPDLPGYDTVTARAWGPSGLACRVTATLAGS
jgi:hypothetical protein